MMIPIDEVAALPGLPSRATIRRWCEAGEITCERVYKGSRLTWRVDIDSIRSKMSGNIDYVPLVERWQAEQASGYHSGRAIGGKSIQLNVDGLKNFWRYLGKEPSVHEVTAENLKTALSNIPVDYQKKNCHYALRMHMYKGVCSFTQLLIRLGKKREIDLVDMRKVKPKRIYPPKKTVLSEQALNKLLAKNEGYKKGGRQDQDIALTQTIIMLGSMAGLRNAEIRNLKRFHIRLDDDELDVIDGKGHKDRTVGIVPKLKRQLRVWLELRPNVKTDYLLIARTGKPIGSRDLSRRLERVAKQASVKVTPHGLRRTFATVNIQKGMPMPIAQKLLGHSDIETTMAYVLIDERTAVDFLKIQAPKGRNP